MSSHDPHPTDPMIASREWKPSVTYYVSHLPTRGGDWGYTENRRGVRGLSGKEGLDKAIALTPYWQRRFAADCRRLGTVATFHTPEAPSSAPVLGHGDPIRFVTPDSVEDSEDSLTEGVVESINWWFDIIGSYNVKAGELRYHVQWSESEGRFNGGYGIR